MSNQSINYSQAFFSSGIMVILAFAISLLTGLPNYIGRYDLNIWLLGAFYGFCLFIAMVLLSKILMPVSSAFRDLTLMTVRLFSQFSWPIIILISIMAGVSEELLFRGVIQTAISNTTTPFLGIVISSFVFGLMHFYNRLYILITFLVGLILGYLYHESKSLVLVMTMHAVYDFFAFMLIVKYPQLLGISLAED